MNRLHFRSANQQLIVACLWILALPCVSDGKEYTTRQLTNFGDPAVGSQATPLAVVNDRLLFLATDNGKEGLYRTDGVTIDLVTDSLVFTTDSVRFPTIETAQLGNELFFAASGPDGRELYATDGWTIRQVANIAPGNLNAQPHSFHLVGDQLLFGALDQASMSGQSVTTKLFRTDGASVEDLKVSYSFGGVTARLGERLIFMGARLDGTSGGPFFSTDGHTIEPIDAPPVSPAAGRPWLFQAGNQVFAISGIGSALAVRRIEGNQALPISGYPTFTSITPHRLTFTIGESLFLAFEDQVRDELIFYRTSGETLSEVSRWLIPSGVFIGLFGPEMVLRSNEHHAYFSFGESVYQFDGISMTELLSDDNSIGQQSIITIDDRTFLIASNLYEPGETYEIVDDALTPLGAGLDTLTIFEDEVFGIDFNTPAPFPPYQLWRTDNDQLVSMGMLAGGTEFPYPLTERSKFVEYRGQLYFPGANGSNTQLYAIVRVPEPSTWMTALVVILLLPQISLTRTFRNSCSAN